ncbi:MAG: B12-binding domain-containing radical SAM protein [Rhodospirillaceae bacterium]|nr:B12-binding domain-containing radical SAM protein [Rhodospirillaceae bacterium]
MTGTKKRLLLVYPNQRWLKDDVVTTWNLDPRMLCQMAAMVDDLVDVRVLDCQFYGRSIQDFETEIRDFAPDFIGISQMTTEYAAVLDAAADACKRASPEAVVIVGGVHVTTCYKWVMDNPSIDYACRGEGEHVLRELMLHLTEGAPFPTTGIVSREHGKMIDRPKAVVDDVTALPWPRYDLVDMNEYVWSVPRQGSNRYPEMPGVPMIISRGCPYLCTFCQVETISGRKVRMLDPDFVVSEIKFLKEQYGIRAITFFDDNFFLPKTGMKELLRKMISEKLEIKWHAAGASLWVIDDEFIDLMKRAGCTGITVAIESGNERVLHDIINKPIKNLKDVPNQIKRITDAGIFVNANFVIGSPGETWEEIRETVYFAETCNADYVKFYVAVPLIGTKMREMAVELGMLDDPNDPLRIDWRNAGLSSHEGEWTAKDVAALRVYEWDRINFQPSRIQKIADNWGLSVDDLNAIRKRTRDSLTIWSTEGAEPALGAPKPMESKAKLAVVNG